MHNTEKQKKVGCVIMASGLSRRFGRNKLLEVFQGKTFIQNVIDLTGNDLFDKRVVVTRSEEVREICEKQNLSVVFHQLPDRNDAVRLGIQEMKDMDACMFCPSDQPLLKRESLRRLIEVFIKSGKGICRMFSGERPGSPILFGKEFFSELSALPPKCGGSFLAKKYPEQVRLVEISNELELYDVDTVADLERLLKEIS